MKNVFLILFSVPLSILPIGLPAQQHTAGSQSAISAGDQPIKLAEFYRGEDGGAYYMGRNGNKVYWFAEHPDKEYAHVFEGVLKDDIIEGTFYSVPKEKTPSASVGSLKIRVLNGGNKLLRLSSPAGFPVANWEKYNLENTVATLPGIKPAAFTSASIGDLDGIWDTDLETRIYVRQYNNTIVAFEESKEHKNGEKPPMARVYVGTRNGNTVSLDVVKVSKSDLNLANTAVKYKVDARNLIKKVAGTGNNYIPSLLKRIIRSVKLPLKDVMNVMEGTFFNNIKIYLDEYRGNGYGGSEGWSQFGNGKREPIKVEQLYETGAQRWHLENMMSSGLDLRPDPNGNPPKWIISVEFEDEGREIICVTRISDIVDEASSGHIENPQVDIYLTLKNSGDYLSYNIDKVIWKGQLDIIVYAQFIDNAINKRVRPTIEAAVKKSLNSNESKEAFKSALKNSITQANQLFQSQLNKIGMSGSPQITSIQIEGDKLVIRFD